MMRRTAMVLGLGVSAALLASGCQLVSGGGGSEAKPSHTSQSGRAGATAAATASPRASGQPVAQPAVSKSVTLPIPGEQGETFTLGFAGLKVKGQLATLTLVWTPHGVGTDSVSIYDMCGNQGDVGGISMIDSVNLKRYVVVSDSDDHELGPDKVFKETGNDQPMTTNYIFAAPQANASMDVYLDDRRVFDSVPVTR